MNSDLLKRYLNKQVKLVQKDGFALYGKSIEIFDDSIVFRTKQRDSVIDNDYIATIVGKGGDY